VNVSTTIPTTVQIKREHLIGLIVAAVALAAVITWLLVAVAFDSGATRTQQDVSQPRAVIPAGAQPTGFSPGYQFPPGYRGMP
jgi:hypothetical protein